MILIISKHDRLRCESAAGRTAVALAVFFCEKIREKEDMRKSPLLRTISYVHDLLFQQSGYLGF